MKQINKDLVLWIPVGLVRLVVEEKIPKPFHLYLYLKSVSSGRIKADRSFISDIAEVYSVAPNTIRNWLKELQRRNWIGLDKLTNTYFIRGFDFVSLQENVNPRYSVAWKVSTIDNFLGLIGATLFSLALNNNRKRFRNQVVSRKGNTLQPDRTSSVFQDTAAIISVARYSGISRSVCQRLRTKAIQHGYILASKQTERTYFDPIFVKSTSHQLNSNYYYQNGFVHRRQPDKLKSRVLLRSTVERRSNLFYSKNAANTP